MSWSLPKFMSIKFVMPSNHLILCHHLLLPLTGKYTPRYILQARILERVKVKVTQSCPTFCNHAPPSMGFSRQEYWSGLPFPSPMDYTVHAILQGRILEWISVPFSKRSSQVRVKPRSPTFQADSLPAEPQGKSKNTGVGSLSLF